ncbi:unnamed protein product [Kuraishia capsulata CBS 1993]|uniref:Uncharacterized protein n=1 Tax=Kuraishia capsulata CBS 1993 TaxID=1382522 RepID=W6MHV5_9ASCO|nr:uncharacterized protein KUCA_T00001900001 [Kuraishia capsulata CBS 1993]CDK25929.1 unnamed protein product [Kuraishia capsulata CBS 1993]
MAFERPREAPPPPMRSESGPSPSSYGTRSVSSLTPTSVSRVGSDSRLSVRQDQRNSPFSNQRQDPQQLGWKNLIPPLSPDNNETELEDPANKIDFSPRSRKYSDRSVRQRSLSGNLQDSKKKTQKLCKNCGEPIVGTLVRAMGNTYHVDCFHCHDCGNQCSNKFFAADIQDPVTKETKEVPLCEFDYFRRIDLICHTCQKAIRGPYITALNRKFHPEHFSCEVCHQVFDAEDYYEYDNAIYCHYHYSKLYASHCEACNSAILKQYVELWRGGRQQQWHPECFMVHKFWGVTITAESIGNVNVQLPKNSKKLSDTEMPPSKLFEIEQKIEEITMAIWLTLSAFEESAASCISDMLYHASVGNKIRGLRATGKLILKIECLFKALDALSQLSNSLLLTSSNGPSDYRQLALKKEPRSLSTNILSYLMALKDADKEKLTSPKFSQDLLALISNLAHYLKLMSRFGLNQALNFNKAAKSTAATDRYMAEIAAHESVPDDVFPILNIPIEAQDLCTKCGQSIEENCVQFDEHRWHMDCFQCSVCSKKLSGSSIGEAQFNSEHKTILCSECATSELDSRRGFKQISSLLQLTYILKIAIVRSMYALEQSGCSDDAPILNASIQSPQEQTFNRTLSDIKRMRSTRQGEKISRSAKQQARRSMIVEAPQADKAATEEFTSDQKLNKTTLAHSGSKRLQIRDFPLTKRNSSTNLGSTSNLLKNEKGLTLDDIPRIVSAEQAREHRPNAFKYQKNAPLQSTSAIPKAKPVRSKNRDSLNQGLPEKLTEVPASVAPSQPQVKRFAELTSTEHFIMGHIAAFALQKLLNDKLSMDEVLGFITTKKPSTFWDKLFGAGKKNGDTNSGVFGVPIDYLTSRYGVESDLGIGPDKLKIPAFIDDCVTAMHNMDLSVEGVFRINGNIKRLRLLCEEIDSHPEEMPDFSKENPIQLAALLKKFLREMPDCLLCFRLYNAWILSQKYSENPATKKRIMQLTYSMLPKTNRDVVEVLLYFFSWSATFAHIDEETGSKMDVHNLATVLSPSILYAKPANASKNSKDPYSYVDTTHQGENYFLGIEVLNSLIESHDEFSIVPQDLMRMYIMGEFHKAGKELTTKEIISKCSAIYKENPQIFSVRVDLSQDENDQPEEPAIQLVNAIDQSVEKREFQTETTQES